MTLQMKRAEQEVGMREREVDTTEGKRYAPHNRVEVEV